MPSGFVPLAGGWHVRPPHPDPAPGRAGSPARQLLVPAFGDGRRARCCCPSRMVLLDLWLRIELRTDASWFVTFGPEGARAILSTIAGSMITVAGLTFSITMLTLQLASSQFGPRLLRSFLRDRGNQVVLGTFISTFLYCLLVLRTVRGTEDASFVPHLAVAAGLLLAVASLAVLIFFIHHTAQSIRLETILADLARETRETIERLYPQEVGQEPEAAPAALPDFDRDGRPVVGRSWRLRADRGRCHAAGACARARPGAAPGRAAGRLRRRHSAASHRLPCSSPSTTASPATWRARWCSARSARRCRTWTSRWAASSRSRSARCRRGSTTLPRRSTASTGWARRCCCWPAASGPRRLRADEAGHVRVVAQSVSRSEAARAAFAAVARYGLGDADVVRHLLARLAAVAAALPPAERAGLEGLAEGIRFEAREGGDALRRRRALGLGREPGRAQPLTTRATRACRVRPCTTMVNTTTA